MRVILLWAMLGAYGVAALMGVVAALSQDSGAIKLLVTSLLFRQQSLQSLSPSQQVLSSFLMSFFPITGL